MSTLSAGRSSLPLLPEARGAGLVPWCRFWLAGQPDEVDVPPRAAKLAPLARRDAADFGAGRLPPSWRAVSPIVCPNTCVSSGRLFPNFLHEPICQQDLHAASAHTRPRVLRLARRDLAA